MTTTAHEDQFRHPEPASHPWVYKTIHLEVGRVTIGAPTEEEVQSIAKRLGYEDH